MTPGTRIDRYEVIRELGRGGLAVVLLVRHTTLGTHHALKVLTTAHRRIADRLVQEGILQARLAHPGIVAVTDVLDVDGAPGLLMEFIDGGTLEDLIHDSPPDPAEAERLFRAVLDAVGHAHAQGVIHRDLKPANVLLRRDAAPASSIPRSPTSASPRCCRATTRASAPREPAWSWARPRT